MRDARPGVFVQIVNRDRVAVIVRQQLQVNIVQYVGRDRLALLHQLVRLQLTIGKHDLGVESANDRIARVLQQQEALLRLVGGFKQVVQQKALVGGGGDLGDKNRVVRRHEWLGFV